MEQDKGASDKSDRAVVNGAASVSAVPASIPSAFRIVEVDKLCKSREGITAAYKLGFPLQENGWIRYPAACWDNPAILVFRGRRCVAGVNYYINEDDCTVDIRFAFCAPDCPNAFTIALLRFRNVVLASKSEEVTFVCHPGNGPMMKAVEVFGLKPTALSFRISAQAIEARSGGTERLDPKGESAVGKADAPTL